MQRQQAKNVIRKMGNVAAALSIFFVFYTLAQIEFDWEAVKDVRGIWAVCAMGVALKMVTVLIMGFSWCLWLEYFSDQTCNRWEALRIYVKANLGKYLPGNVMHYVERNLFAEALGLSGRKIALSSVCEVAGLVAASILLAAILGYKELIEAMMSVARLPGRAAFFGLMVVLVAGGLALTGYLGICRKGCLQDQPGGICRKGCLQDQPESILRKRRWNAMKRPGLALQLGKSLAMEGIVLVLLGIILVCLYACLYQKADWQTGRLLVSAYIIAWMLGFLVPGASGGIGVRELVLTLLLSPVTGREAIVVLGVLHRLITVAGDFALYLLWGVAHKVHGQLMKGADAARRNSSAKG